MTALPWQAPTTRFGLAFCGTNRECERSSQQSPGSTWIGVQVPEPRSPVASPAGEPEARRSYTPTACS